MSKFSILEVIYQLVKSKIHQKRSLLKPKIIPKRLLNNSKATLKKPRKRVFDPEKSQNALSEDEMDKLRAWQQGVFHGKFSKMKWKNFVFERMDVLWQYLGIRADFYRMDVFLTPYGYEGSNFFVKHREKMHFFDFLAHNIL